MTLEKAWPGSGAIAAHASSAKSWLAPSPLAPNIYEPLPRRDRVSRRNRTDTAANRKALRSVAKCGRVPPPARGPDAPTPGPRSAPLSVSFVLKKLLRLVVTIWAAATLVFIMLRLAGDPVVAMVPADAPQIVIDRYRERFGLDQPFYLQYFAYLRGILQGDFGISFRTTGPAWDLVAPRIVPTLVLTGTATVIAVILGIPAGLLAAARHNSVLDRLVMSFSIFGFAMPNFFLGILLILLFTLKLRLLPSGGFESPASLLMPALTLGLASAGAYARLTRSSVLEVIGSPYMRTARANGVPPLRRMTRHVLRAVLVPLVTLAGFSVGALIAGAVVTETVFAWPGLGRLLVISVGERDLAVVQLIVILAAAAMAITNMVVDLLYGWLDPRIGTRRRAGEA